jgi:hypothetical protein
MMSRFRLTDARLEQLLETDPQRFERLIERNPALADRFEQPRLLSDDARAALRDAFAPPADLAERLRTRLAALDEPTARSTALDLLGLGLATVRELTRDQD